MLGAGSVAAMIQSIRSNRALLKEKSKAFANRTVKDGVFIHNKLRFKRASPEEMQHFREKLEAEKKKGDLIFRLIWLTGILLLALAIYLISA